MNILVGYDGSAVSKDAVKLAITHARAFDGKIFVASSMKGGPQVELSEIEKVESELDQVRDDVKREGLPCESQLLFRGLEPGEDLVKFATEKQIELIVIGVKRRSKVGKLLFGSTAQYVILESRCPVLTVK